MLQVGSVCSCSSSEERKIRQSWHVLSALVEYSHGVAVILPTLLHSHTHFPDLLSLPSTGKHYEPRETRQLWETLDVLPIHFNRW